MAVRHARWILLAAATLGLSGCTSVFKAVFARHSQPVLVRAAPPSPAATSLTEAGRTYLAAGNTGLAIEAFQHAIGMGEPAAPALNGLGVAYARLDRFETAQKLFAQALALAPDNAQYAANMARLLRSPALAARHDADIAAEIAAAAPPAPAPSQPAPGQLVRVSANEFRIVTVEPAAAPLLGKKPARQVALVARHNADTAARPRSAAPAALAPVTPASETTPAGAAPATLVNPFVADAASAPTPAMTVETRKAPDPAPSAEADGATL